MAKGDDLAKATFQDVPVEVIRACLNFCDHGALLQLRLVSTGLRRLCPSFNPARDVCLRFWKMHLRRRTAVFIPQQVSIAVNEYVTLAGVKAKVAAAGVCSADSLQGHTLIPGPHDLEVGLLQEDSDPLWNASLVSTLYLVPPPLDVAARPRSKSVVVIPKRGEKLEYDRSDFLHFERDAKRPEHLSCGANLVVGDGRQLPPQRPPSIIY